MKDYMNILRLYIFLSCNSIESFSFCGIVNELISTKDYPSVDLKATAYFSEFTYLLKENYLRKYSSETDCSDNCFSCSET